MTAHDLLRDDLTGLGSLLALRRYLETLVEGYPPFGARPAVLLIDIDGFDALNALCGRAVGDEVLAALAARLRMMVPGEQLTYRTGGDEFVAVLEPAGSIDAVATAGAVQTALGAAVDAGGRTVSVTVSVAVVMLGHRQRVDGLLRDADVTMYRAKAEGGNRVDVYNWEVDGWSTARRRSTELLEREVLELRQQNRLLKGALTVDLATGLANGLAFERDHARAAAGRSGRRQPYSVVRARVDGLYESGRPFRSAAGEKALGALAHRLRDTVRGSGHAFVLDRGEYAVLLPGARLGQAVAAAEGIKAALAAPGIADPRGGGRPLTASIAAVEAGPGHGGPAEVMGDVDRLLDRAAAQGGDRVVWPS